MKKLTALFTIVALLVCMFAFAPTASAVSSETLPNAKGERVWDTEELRNGDDVVEIYYEIVCYNGWADETFGSDHVEGYMSSDTYFPSCSAIIEVEAEYIVDGEYVSDFATDSQTYLASGFSVSVYPNTTYLSCGYATFSFAATGFGGFTESLSAQCPVAVR